jgi:hypothetical protein
MNVSPFALFSFKLFPLFHWAVLHILAFHFGYSSYSNERFSIFPLFISVIPVIPLDVSPYSLFSFRLFQLFQWAFLHILSFHFSYPSYSIERFSIFSHFILVIPAIPLSVSPYSLCWFPLLKLFHWAFVHILSFNFSYSSYSIDRFSIFSLFISIISVIALSVSPYYLFSLQLFQSFQWAFLHILSFHFSYSSYSIERFSICSLFI